ncbi:MAG: LiaI-LiaF-like domain-containing protein [Halarsenatibacteraceae bacterium]
MSKSRIFGLILILLGGFIILNNAGMIDLGIGEIISTYWPLILIFAGIYNLLTNPAGRLGGLIVLLIGLFFQMNNLDYIIASEYISFWPVIFILIGVSLLFDSKGKGKEIDREKLNIFNMFSGSEYRIISNNFRGGSSITIFGGADIDLSGANISEGEARLDVFTLFGGADIYVPEDWQVVVKGLPIFGGWDNLTRQNINHENSKVLSVSCLAIFGGVDIKNKK